MNTGHFGLAHWCVLVAALLPIVCAGIAKWGMLTRSPQQGGYDNSNPRAWLGAQSAWRARANAAQANSFEGLPFFIGAVALALQLGADSARVDQLALAYVVLRVAYIGLYVMDQASLRSVVFTAAFVVNGAILFSGYR